jgi:hypothetical protein
MIVACQLGWIAFLCMNDPEKASQTIDLNNNDWGIYLYIKKEKTILSQ